MCQLADLPLDLLYVSTSFQWSSDLIYPIPELANLTLIEGLFLQKLSIFGLPLYYVNAMLTSILFLNMLTPSALEAEQ